MEEGDLDVSVPIFGALASPMVVGRFLAGRSPGVPGCTLYTREGAAAAEGRGSHGLGGA